MYLLVILLFGLAFADCIGTTANFTYGDYAAHTTRYYLITLASMAAIILYAFVAIKGKVKPKNI
jgi:hypothetical protein